MAHIFRERRGAHDEERLRQLAKDEAGPAPAGECAPPIDVIETASGIELLMDLPGVPGSSVNVVFSQGTLIVSGRKLPATCVHREAAFHLAERSFGRFARAVRLTGAFDGGKATAVLASGELRIVLPRVEDRRGRDIRIAITGS